ncbi:aminoglycoside phosphotransferase family protein [Dactylosporangium vinaceum]|uniref:Aminoglycoside phosphotransferase family protein n=1 Tax=Dactylosporangium vinaceum TaxID=53362 RepID=A0ABV5MMC4_9ACTN|nr:aminoglycoside phosphotransferase family protein [Dactylosporangium vinaceum]UAB93297.1 aminoglycoside phosphotransferase family protein [Dactylosporangium vinaceum]
MVAVDLVRALVATQFPQWAGLPVSRFASSGTDNTIFRLGPDLGVRMPLGGNGVGQLELERRWLPGLAAHLPAAVPDQVAVGAPGLGYPHPWAVYRWLDGANPDRLDDLAADLADFVLALRDIDAGGGPAARYGGRGGSLRGRDVSEWIAQLAGDYDPALLTAVWQGDRDVEEWGGPPVWVHGDLHPANLLARGGRLTAVLDWSCLTTGDPAIDLMPAWLAMGPAARGTFRELVGADAATWRRGRAWAFSVGLGAFAYYRQRNAYFGALGKYAIDQVLAER